jgi:regulatory protein
VPVVTGITRQKREGSNRFNVSLDGSYAFTMSDLELSGSGLRVGQELSPAEVEKFTEDAKGAKAYALALRYLGVRLRSRRELMDYLSRKGCEPVDAEGALARLEELGLVDDAKFARAWIADRMALRPRSRMQLAQELTAKGIARDAVDEALREIEPEKETATLAVLIERKKRAGYSDEKLVAYLQRKGYRWNLIKEVMKQQEEGT